MLGAAVRQVNQQGGASRLPEPGEHKPQDHEGVHVGVAVLREVVPNDRAEERGEEEGGEVAPVGFEVGHERVERQTLPEHHDCVAEEEEFRFRQGRDRRTHAMDDILKKEKIPPGWEVRRNISLRICPRRYENMNGA